MSDICIISDGKPGHVNQSLGLVDALRRAAPQLSCTEHTILSWRAIFALIAARVTGKQHAFSHVKLVVGTGRRTHLSLLALQWIVGCKAVVLMRPSLPSAWFSAAIIPEHDQPPELPNTLATLGALNRMQPGTKQVDQGLILVGGPSKHFDWSDDHIWQQIDSLLEDTTQQWLLTTSRRTPESFLQRATDYPQLCVMPFENTSRHWLPEQLASASACWVTEDSISMVYEALSAGCETGVFELPIKSGGSRVTRGLARLKASMRVMTLTQRQRSTDAPLAEADRAAAWIMKKGWL